MSAIFKEFTTSGIFCKGVAKTIIHPRAYRLVSCTWRDQKTFLLPKQTRKISCTNKCSGFWLNSSRKNDDKKNFKAFSWLRLPQRLSKWQKRTIKTLPGHISGPSDKEIENFLRRFKIPYRNGYTSIVAPCQNCKILGFDDNAKADNKNWSLFINRTTGRFICKKCGNSGAWHEIKVCQILDGTKVVGKDAVQPSLNLKAARHKPNTEDALTIFENAKCLSDVDQTELEIICQKFNTQLLSMDTLKKYGIKFTSHKFLETDGMSKSQKCLVIPWYDITSETITAVKIFPLESDLPPKFIPRKYAGSLFGSKQSTKNSKEIVLTSSEFDAMAVDQATSLNAVALPSSISVLPLEALPQLEQFEKVILWFGNDARSKQAVNQFSKKLNMERCSFVRLLEEDSPSGALEALNKGFNLKALIAKAQSLKHKEILTFSQLREDVLGEFLNADEAAGVKWKRFPGLTSILKGHRRGELSILTGQTGTGKTTLLSELSLDLCSQGVSTLWGSFEIKNVRLLKAMMCQYSGLNLETAIGQYNFWADKFDMLPLYFMSYFGAQSIQTVLETMSHAAYVYDIEHVILDNLQFMMSTSAVNFSDRFSTMDLAISSLRNFASSTNVHVTLVIHPRKENQDIELQTASIFGTAKASQEADNIIILQDTPGRTSRRYLQVTKNRFDGALGKAPLQFNRDSLCMSGFCRDLKTGSTKFGVGTFQGNSKDQ
eukprot:gene11654-21901_t